MNQNKVIEEVDEKLQGDVGSTKRVQGFNAIYGELNNAQREVDKFVGKMKHYISRSTSKQQQSIGKREEVREQQNNTKREHLIGRYNYYGKKYRFEQKEEELNIQPPKNIKKLYNSQVNLEEPYSRPMTPRTWKFQKKQEKQSLNATVGHIDQSLFFDDGQIKMPSNQYYIYFDKPTQNTSKQMKKFNRTFQQSVFSNPKQQNHQKFKPAWVMEKKINTLQKQLKEMKERERKRYQQHYFDTHKMRNTADGPIKLKSNIQRMVETLWR